MEDIKEGGGQRAPGIPLPLTSWTPPHTPPHNTGVTGVTELSTGMTVVSPSYSSTTSGRAPQHRIYYQRPHSAAVPQNSSAPALPQQQLQFAAFPQHPQQVDIQSLQQQQHKTPVLNYQQPQTVVLPKQRLQQSTAVSRQQLTGTISQQAITFVSGPLAATSAGGISRGSTAVLGSRTAVSSSATNLLSTVSSLGATVPTATIKVSGLGRPTCTLPSILRSNSPLNTAASPGLAGKRQHQQLLKTLTPQQTSQPQQLFGLQRVHSVTVPAGVAVSSGAPAQSVMASTGQQTTTKTTGLRLWLSPSSASGQSPGAAATGRVASDGTTTNTVFLPSGFDVSKLYPELSKLGFVRSTSSSSPNVSTSKLIPVVSSTVSIGNNALSTSFNSGAVVTTSVLTTLSSMGSLTRTSATNLASNACVVNSYQVVSNTGVDSQATINAISSGGTSCNNSNKNVSKASVRQYISVASLANAGVLQSVTNKNNGGQQTSAFLNVIKVAGGGAGGSAGGGGTARLKVVSGRGGSGGGGRAVLLAPVTEPTKQGPRLLASHDGTRVVSVQCGSGGLVAVSAANTRLAGGGGTATVTSAALPNNTLLSSPSSSSSNIINSNNCTKDNNTALIVVSRNSSFNRSINTSTTAGVAIDGSVLNTLADRNGTVLYQRIASTAPSIMTGASGALATERSIREAEARQKQLQLQRQLQQIHGGLSRAGLSSGAATVTPVKQFRLSQQQVASLLSQSSVITSLPQSVVTSSGGSPRQIVSLASAGGQNAIFVTSPAGQGGLFSASAAQGTVLSSSGQETIFTLQRQSGVSPGQQGSPVLVSAAHGTVFSPMLATSTATKRKASPMSAYSPRSAKTMRAAGTAVVVEGVQVPGSSQVIDPAVIRRQRDIRTKRKADKESPESLNGYVRQRSVAPHTTSTNHQSKIKGNTCDSSSSTASQVEATSSIITSPGTSTHPSSNSNNVKSLVNLLNVANHNSERVHSTPVKDTHVFSLPVLTNARVSSILKDITLPDQQQSQGAAATVLKASDSVVSSILKDYNAAPERAVLLSPGLGRRVSFSPETVERLGPGGRKNTRDLSAAATASQFASTSSAANSFDCGTQQTRVTAPENRNYSRKNRAVSMPVAHRGTASPERCENTSPVTEQLLSTDTKTLTARGATEGLQEGLKSRCASVHVLPRLVGLPSLVRESSHSRWPGAVLRLHDTLLIKHNASLDMLPAGLHDLDSDEGDTHTMLTSRRADGTHSYDNHSQTHLKAISNNMTPSTFKSELPWSQTSDKTSTVPSQAKRGSLSRLQTSASCRYDPSQTSAEVLSLLQLRLLEAKQRRQTKNSQDRPSSFLQQEQEDGRRLWCRVRAHKARQGDSSVTKMLLQAARHSPSLTAATLAHVRGTQHHSSSPASSTAAGELSAPSSSVTPSSMLFSRQLNAGAGDSMSVVERPSRKANKQPLQHSCLLESRFCAYEISLCGGGGISSTAAVGGFTASVCGLPALPGTRHCLRHITYNVDQQLFSQCCARTADGVGAMCRVPVFALTDQPVCPLHRAAEAQDGMTSSSSPCSPASSRKPRKKGKLTTLSRYGKRKRRRSSTPHSHSGGKGGKGGGKGGGKACGKGKGSGKVVPSTAVRPPMNNGLVLPRTPSFNSGPYDLLPSSPPNTPAFTPTCSECGSGADGGCGCCCDREDGSLDGSLDASLELPGNVVAAASRLLDLHDLLLDHDQHEEDLFSQQTDVKEPLVCASEEGNKNLAVSCISLPASVPGVDNCHLTGGDLLPPASHQLYPCSASGSQVALQQSAADSSLTAAALASYASVLDQTNPIDSMISSSFNQQELNVINQFLGNIVGQDASLLLSQPPTDTTNTVMSVSTSALPAVSSAISCLSATSCSPTHTGLSATANTAVPSTTHGNHCDVPPLISAVASSLTLNTADTTSSVAVATSPAAVTSQLASGVSSAVGRSLGVTVGVTAGHATSSSNQESTDTALRLPHQSGMLMEPHLQQASYVMCVQATQSISTCGNTTPDASPCLQTVAAASRECHSVITTSAQTPHRHHHLFNGSGLPVAVSLSSQSPHAASVVSFNSSPSVCRDAAVASYTAATCNTSAMAATLPLAATAAAAVVSCPSQTGGCTVSNSPTSLDTSFPDASAAFNQLPSPSMPPTPSDDDMTTMVEFPSATEQRHSVGQLDSETVTAFEPGLTELDDEEEIETSLGHRQTALLSPRPQLRRAGHELLLCRGGDCKGLPTGFSLLDAAQNALPHLH